MSSRLYDRLGITGPLLEVTAGDVALGDRVSTVRAQRGGTDLSSYSASTLTVDTPTTVPVQECGKDMSVRLVGDALAQLADVVNQPESHLQWRYKGRVATATTHDKGISGRPRGTTLNGAAWPSLYENAPDTFTPAAGTTLRQAAEALLRPTWAPHTTLEWPGDSEYWPAPEDDDAHDPITASDLLGILSSRLYMLGDTRHGHFRVGSLDWLEDNQAQALTDLWPLARAHCLAPTTWEQPSAVATEYLLSLREPAGSVYQLGTREGGPPEDLTRLVEQDWSDIVASTEQWRRIYGMRDASRQNAWRLPNVTVRLDHLIASTYESHRRAAGMLLRLNPGDPVPLAGDWPPSLEGVHFVTSIEETITPRDWSLTLGLVPWQTISGRGQSPIRPRTWDQASRFTWADASAARWDAGLPKPTPAPL